MKLTEGTAIVVVLQEPREKIWGVMREINSAGVFVKGLDLNSFEDLVQATANNAPFYGMGEYFFPMWRIERITNDDDDGDIPSMQEQFEQRTGLNISDFFE